MTSVLNVRLASWRWMSAAAVALVALLAALSPISRELSPVALSPAPNASTVSEPAADPLTPAVAQIAWRDPRQRIEAIVQFQPQVGPAAAREMVRANGGKVIAELGIISGLAAEMSAGDAAKLARSAGVHAVSLNAKIAPRAVDISPRELATSFNASVRSPKVWYGNKYNATGAGVGVAVLDTGVQGDLPDFRDDQGNSRVHVVASTHPGAGYGDGYGHGTHVAGLIAGDGTNRADGLAGRYAGVAPEAHLISVKVGNNEGEATLLDVIYGLQFVVDHKDDYNIRVANLSLNSTVAESYMTDPLDAAVEQAWFAGIVVVAAAGNRGTAEDAVNYAPANDPYVISVGGVDDRGTNDVTDDVLAAWSSRGTTQDGFSKPEVLAPGAHIVSTLSPGSEVTRICPECVRDGAYFQMGGTSMAAAIASGVAALLIEEHPDWTPDQIKGALSTRLRDVPGAGGETAADKALTASGSVVANEGLTPSELIDPTTHRISWERLRWSRLRWSSDESGADWSRLRWSLAPETVAEDEAAAVDPDHLRWSHMRWSHMRWSASFSK